MRPAFLSGLTLIKRQDLLMAPTYKTFQDEESLLSQPPKDAWATRKAAGLGAALLLVAVLGVSTVSHVNPMFDIVRSLE